MNLQTIKSVTGRLEYVLLPVIIYRSMQNQIDKLNSSIHFVEANRYYNGVQYNERQAQKQEEVQRMQKQLDEQKKQLEDMQESARKAGLGSSVYEP